MIEFSIQGAEHLDVEHSAMCEHLRNIDIKGRLCRWWRKLVSEDDNMRVLAVDVVGEPSRFVDQLAEQIVFDDSDAVLKQFENLLRSAAKNWSDGSSFRSMGLVEIQLRDFVRKVYSIRYG